MQSQASKIVLAIIVTAIVAGSVVFFWQNKKQPLQEVPATEPEVVSTQTNYTNSKWHFSLEIPKGYFVDDNDTSLNVVKKATPDDETPLPEINIRIEQNSTTEIEPTQSMSIIIKEAVTINGVQGMKSTVSYSVYPAGNKCPIYRLHQNGVVYEFSLYECLDSSIFEEVVGSFKVTQ